MDCVNYLAATTIQSVTRMHLCQLDYIRCYQAPPAIQMVQHQPMPNHDVLSTPSNESKLLVHHNMEFISNIIFNMKQVQYQIQYIFCTPSKIIVSSTVQVGNNKNFDVPQ